MSRWSVCLIFPAGIILCKPLPAGIYAYQFVLKDVFGNEWAKVHVPFEWDGEKVTYDFEQYKSLLNSR